VIRFPSTSTACHANRGTELQDCRNTSSSEATIAKRRSASGTTSRYIVIISPKLRSSTIAGYMRIA
jgi:hypothetical protein